MELEVIVTWDQSKPFEEAGQYGIAVNVLEPVVGFKENYSGRLNGKVATEHYIDGIIYRATGEGTTYYEIDEKTFDLKTYRKEPIPTLELEESGKRVYRMEVKEENYEERLADEEMPEDERRWVEEEYERFKEQPYENLKVILERLEEQHYIASRDE